MPLKAYLDNTLVEAGCDEAGRGCFAGPVFAAAVILPKDFSHPVLNDSKQLKEADRYMLREVIEKEALAFAVAEVSNVEIDKINILNASILAMHKAIVQLKIKPQQLLIDGNRFKAYKGIPYQCVIKGDGIYASIAAASILAKTYRDDLMVKLHEQHPQYGWNENKGYGTAQHRVAIEKHGVTEYHRKSFKLVEWDLFHQH
jgi:ribonuclease HII